MTDTAKITMRGALLLCACVAHPASAQEYPRLSAAAAGTSVNATSVLSNGTAEMQGTLYGGEGQVSWKGLSLRLGYSQGTLGIGASAPGSSSGNPADGGVVGSLLQGLFGGGGGAATPFDLQMVDGHALVGWHAVAGLALEAGLQGRARFNDDESERILLWVVRGRYEVPIIAPQVRGYVDGWSSLAGSATAPQRSVNGHGASAGVIAQLGPVLARLSYGIDVARYGDGVRRETLQGLGIGIGYVVR